MPPSSKEVETSDLCEFKASLGYIVSSRTQGERKRKEGRGEEGKEEEREGRKTLSQILGSCLEMSITLTLWAGRFAGFEFQKILCYRNESLPQQNKTKSILRTQGVPISLFVIVSLRMV